MNNKLVQAMQLAADLHEQQTDKNGSPFIGHPARVAFYLAQDYEPDDNQLIAACLHDIVEDTPTTLDYVEREFGPDVAGLVWAITRQSESGEQYAAYIDRIIVSGPRAIELKLCDLRDNMDPRRPVDDGFASMIENRYEPARKRLEEAL